MVMRRHGYECLFEARKVAFFYYETLCIDEDLKFAYLGGR